MLNSIQTLRALAAWLVVGHHYMQLAHNFQLSDPISISLQRYGAIGVDLFFIISGFVIYISATGKIITPFEFATHRLARIAPAYWLFTLITVATLILLPNAIPLTEFEPAFALKSLLFAPAQNPSGIGLYPLITVGWTLNYEMAFYGVFLISLFLPRKFRILAITLGVTLLYKAIPSAGGVFAFYNNPIIFEFIFGIFIAFAHQKGLVQRINLTAAILMIAASIGVIVYFGQVTHSPIKSGLPCAIVLLSALSQERFFSGATAIYRLGNWSYSTYLCHVLVISLMIQLQQLMNLNTFVTLAMILAIILFVSWLSFHFIETPISRLAKNGLKKTANSATKPI
jgi:peptidoglycan/LPS O-acetylase OafA/YrhL